MPSRENTSPEEQEKKRDSPEVEGGEAAVGGRGWRHSPRESAKAVRFLPRNTVVTLVPGSANPKRVVVWGARWRTMKEAYTFERRHEGRVAEISPWEGYGRRRRRRRGRRPGI